MDDYQQRQDENLNEYGARVRGAYESGALSEDDYFRLMSDASEALYLSQDNPRLQSGHSGGPAWYRYKKQMILEAVDRPGTFLDVGCANGHLIECLDKWLTGSDIPVEFHGLEISEGLAAFARERLPAWRRRIHQGNALFWDPALRFDYVYSMILPDYPPGIQRRLLDRLVKDFSKPDGRVILGPWDEHGVEDEIRGWGYQLSGYVEKSFPNRSYPFRRCVWIDGPDRGQDSCGSAT